MVRDFPVNRERPLDPPDALASLRADDPVCPLRLPDGTDGWVVTGHAEARALLADERFSARQELRRMPPGCPTPPAAAPGFFVRMDSPEHPRYRRLVTGYFTRRRLQALRPRVEAIADAHLDALAAAGPPADLVAALALPIPAIVIGEILGVDAAGREEFQRHSRTAVDATATPERVSEALGAINAALTELVARRASEPGDDVLSELLATGGPTAREVASIGFLLLVAGHETTSAMLGLGLYALLACPDALAAARPALIADADPLAPNTPAARVVDELLRHQTINQFGAMRVAREDVDLDGRPVAAGEAVVVSLPAANRDPRAFDEPDTLLLDRPGPAHLAFGHGPHLCSGAALARLELRVVWGRLLRRFPGLALAVPADRVPLRDRMSVYGVAELPVRW